MVAPVAKVLSRVLFVSWVKWSPYQIFYMFAVTGHSVCVCVFMILLEGTADSLVFKTTKQH